MSTATRRIKELEAELKRANYVIAGLMEYAERAESTACAFAFDLQRNSRNFEMSVWTRKRALESFEKSRQEAGDSGKFFGG